MGKKNFNAFTFNGEKNKNKIAYFCLICSSLRRFFLVICRCLTRQTIYTMITINKIVSKKLTIIIEYRDS